jgi:hypothetical protein
VASKQQIEDKQEKNPRNEAMICVSKYGLGRFFLGFSTISFVGFSRFSHGYLNISKANAY